MLCLWRKNNMEKKNLPYMKPHHTLVADGFALPIEVNLPLAICLFDSAPTAMSSFKKIKFN